MYNLTFDLKMSNAMKSRSPHYMLTFILFCTDTILVMLSFNVILGVSANKGGLNHHLHIHHCLTLRFSTHADHRQTTLWKRLHV